MLFDLPPQLLGVERDVNRSTAAEMNDQAFRQAIVPTARLFAEHITRDAISKKLGWNDLEFVFADTDVADEMEEAADPGNSATQWCDDDQRSPPHAWASRTIRTKRAVDFSSFFTVLSSMTRMDS